MSKLLTNNGLSRVIVNIKDLINNHTHKEYLSINGGIVSNSIKFSTHDIGIEGTIAGSDAWRIVGMSTDDDEGYLEIATADNASEPICVRQYMTDGSDYFATIKRTAYLLDKSGNTSFPGKITAGSGFVTGNAKFNSDGNIWMPWANAWVKDLINSKLSNDIKLSYQHPATVKPTWTSDSTYATLKTTPYTVSVPSGYKFLFGIWTIDWTNSFRLIPFQFVKQITTDTTGFLSIIYDSTDNIDGLVVPMMFCVFVKT